MAFKLPEPHIDERDERELLRLLEKGFSANRWRSDYYDWTQKRIWAEQYQGRMIARLEKWLGKLSGKTVLDLGTGRGGLAVALLFRGAHPVATDLRRRSCKILGLRSKRYNAAVPSAQALGENLPFAADSFDVVVCKDVLEHCKSPQQIIAEIARVLRPGGAAYVTFINRFAWIDPHYHLPGVNFLPRWMAEMVINRAGRSKSNIRDLQRLSDMHYYTLAAAQKLASTEGLLYHDLTLEALKNGNGSPLKRFAHSRLSLSAGTLEALLKKPAKNNSPR